ncbi:MAG: class I SAM-dependent methyltransferase [Acidimicrobiia bacterium]|nr:class I SAM-dependent methyltransferase [Acidimicrobiia bacterium]
MAAADDRFQFGENWRAFLLVLDDDRIRAAEASLRSLLGVERLEGKRFLDAGSGSGLFSLAAYRLGATVHSFDYDPQSVACTAELRRRFDGSDENRWVVEQASILDRRRLAAMGVFDVVYSWGVVHHTGAMWGAVGNLVDRVAPGGLLALSIYNDQGRKSRLWAAIKRRYVGASPIVQRTMVVLVAGALEGREAVGELARGRSPTSRWRHYRENRGMSLWHDLVDWVGGWPFEVASPAEVRMFCEQRGVRLVDQRTTGGHGCNEYVFRRLDITGVS